MADGGRYMSFPVVNKDDIKERVRTVRKRLEMLGVRSIGLFGSFVREEQTLSNDVDMLVEFEPRKNTFDNFMEVSFLLEGLF